MFKTYITSFLKYNSRKTIYANITTNVLSQSKCYSNITTSLRPRRALLYVPGHDKRKIEKAFNLEVDSIALDCEDGVSINKKVEARETIRSIFENGKPTRVNEYDLGVRVNSVDTKLFAEDVRCILSAKYLPDTILLPKVNQPEDIKEFRCHIQKYSANKDTKFDLIMYIESARAIINMVDICNAAVEEGKAGNFVPAALVFGGDDFFADIGAAKSDDYQEVSYARQKVVLVAKAFRMQAIDVVHIKFKELEQLKLLSEQGARLGFTGKQVIHPDQVPIVQKSFLPNEKQIEWAVGLLEAFEEHQKLGKGAFSYRGSMIDMPTMKQAQNIINLIKKT